MATEVTIPTVGESITSGVLAAWHVEDGAIVQKDQHLYDLETDKITAEGLAECGGKIHLKVAAGDEVEIGQVAAVIDETVTAPKPEPTQVSSQPPSKSAAETAKVADESLDPLPATSTLPVAEPLMTSVPQLTPSAAMTPLASDQDSPRTTRKRMSPLRKRIAERLVAAQQRTAHLTTFNEVDMSAVLQLRKSHQETFMAKYGVKLGFMSFFIKATVQALKEVPNVNTQIDDDTLIENHYYDIGIAVSTEKGLVVPVVRDCDRRSFAEIEAQILDYAQRARAAQLKLEELEGGVFTITNGGIYGSLLSTPILNPPQSAILGMHTIKERPVVVEGAVVPRPMMYLALSYDHRAIDGKEAVTFLVKLKQLLEEPTLLLFSH